MAATFRRGQIKSAITRLQNFIQSFTNTPANQTKLESRIQNLTEVIQQLPGITETLFVQDPDMEHGNHGDIEFEIMENYMDVLSEAKLLRTSQTTHSETESIQSTPHSINTNDLHNHVDKNLTRIPKMELRKFDGSIDQWKSFADWFIGTIHNRKGITDSMKLTYLHDSLTGEAAKTIAGFETTNENYQEAWNLLKLTYDNERVIVFRYFQLLMEIPKMQNNSAEAIRQLINEVQVQIRKMKVMGQPIDQWNVPLIYIVNSKLDEKTRREWNRKTTGNQIPEFEEFMTFLREEAARMQTSSINSSDTNQNKTRVQYNNDKTKNKRVMTTTVTQKCPICEKDDGHPTFKCPKLLGMTVPQRISAVRNANLCFNCLRSNHRTNECYKRNCFKCSKHHHTSLHLEKSEEKADQNQPTTA